MVRGVGGEEDMTNKPRTCSFCLALKGNNRRKLVLEIELKKKEGKKLVSFRQV